MVDTRGALILVTITTIGAPLGVWLLQLDRRPDTRTHDKHCCNGVRAMNATTVLIDEATILTEALAFHGHKCWASTAGVNWIPSPKHIPPW
jgi:hypothetical protein